MAILRSDRGLSPLLIGGLILLVVGSAPYTGRSSTRTSDRPEAIKAVSDLRITLERRASPAGLRRLQQALAKAGPASALNGYGMALLLAGSPGDALYVLSAAAAGAPDDFLAFNNLGAVLNNLGQYQRARPLLRYADELSPDNPMVLSNLGAAELGEGRSAEAEKLFSRAVKIAPNHPQANYALGRLARRRNDLAAARRHLDASLDSSYTAAAAEALKDVDRALRRSGSAKAEAPGAQPPVPFLAAEAGKEASVRLPMVQAGNSAECIAARRALETEGKMKAAWAMTLNEELRRLLPIGPQARPSGGAATAAAPASGARVLRLTPDKAKRGLRGAELWLERLSKSRERFVGDIHARWMEAVRKRGELEKAGLAEEERCRTLEPKLRGLCLEEVKRRACARHAQTFDGEALAVSEAYAQFAPAWEAEALAYHRAVNYWASFIPDPVEAARTRLGARGAILTNYSQIVDQMLFMFSALAPHESCLKTPPPAQSIEGELRLEDFKVPCTFPGLGLDLAVVSFHIDCTTVTVGGDIGIAAVELEWNFVEKTGTLFIGAEAGLEAGKLVSAGTSARAGLVLSFDGESMTDIGLEAKASVGMKLGEALTTDLGGASAGFRIGLNSTPTFF